MLIALEDVRLTNGERVAAAAIRAPDLAWADRIEALLGHKPPFWSWQNSQVVRRELGLDAHFYVLHRDGVPFAHVLTTEVARVGLLGHVFTRQEDRRKGAARQLMERQLAHFRARSGRALFLKTGYATPPFALYERLGFTGIEPESGSMALYAGEDRAAFEQAWFAAGPTTIEPPAWPHWPGSAPLFLADTPGVVRCAGRGLLGRAMTEGPILAILRDHQLCAARGEPPQAMALVASATGAMVGLVHTIADPVWPDTAILDVHCHPHFAEHGTALLAALPPTAHERTVCYADIGWQWKEDLLTTAGFARTAVLRRWVTADAAKSHEIDVGLWVRRG